MKYCKSKGNQSEVFVLHRARAGAGAVAAIFDPTGLWHPLLCSCAIYCNFLNWKTFSCLFCNFFCYKSCVRNFVWWILGQSLEFSSYFMNYYVSSLLLQVMFLLEELWKSARFSRIIITFLHISSLNGKVKWTRIIILRLIWTLRI